MSKNYLIEEQDGISIITLAKNLSFDDAMDVMNSAMDFITNKRRLWIATESINFSSDELRTIANLDRENFQKSSIVAYVAEDDLSFALIGMFEVFSEDNNPTTKVFREKDDAINWLKSWDVQ